MSDKDPDRDERLVEIGVLVKPHGLGGACKLLLHNPASTALEQLDQLVLELPGQERRATAFRRLGVVSGYPILQLPGTDDRTAAESLRGAKVLVPRQSIAAEEDDQYLYIDLIGCRVLDEQGQTLGTVRRIFSAGASDVLVVADDQVERMIPLVEQWVSSIDLQAREIRIVDAEQWEPQPLK
jgi:16S rRNA processing protein RimM